MGRSQNKSKASPRPNKYTKKTLIGRPEDDILETFFMKKLRSGKLQSINAESEAEIECHRFQDTLIEKKPKRSEGFREQKVEQVLQLFLEMEAERFGVLWDGFKKGCQKWEFKEITSINDFPEFLFCDECDLCYVLHYILTSNNQQLKAKTDFANDQLLFLQLLCFASRDQISFRALRSILGNLNNVLPMMGNIKSAVLSIVGQQQGQEFKAAAPAEIPPQIPIQINSNILQKEQSSVLPEKTKMIEKPKDKKRGRPKKVEAQVSEEQLLSQSQLEQLMHKLITHIVRCYAYIYPIEARKSVMSQQLTQGKADSK